jgi:hypothetical protein
MIGYHLDIPESQENAFSLTYACRRLPPLFCCSSITPLVAVSYLRCELDFAPLLATLEFQYLEYITHTYLLMEAGWGFHVSLEALAKSAYVWQHLRPFRLVLQVARQAMEPAAKNIANLASLPQEIIDIIEDDLTMHAHALVMAQEPFHFSCYDCDAFWDQFNDSKHYNDALALFQTSYIRDHSLQAIDAGEENDLSEEMYDDLVQEAHDAFSDTAEYDEICEAFMQIHQLENGCDTYNEDHGDFWLGVSMHVGGISSRRDEHSELETSTITHQTV